MEYIMGKKLANISWDMNIIKTLCKINEYKGEQIIYKKQSKNMVSTTTEEAITKFVYDTHIDNFMGGEENLIKLCNIKQIVQYAVMKCQPVWIDEGYDGKLIAYYYKPETEKAWNYWKNNRE